MEMASTRLVFRNMSPFNSRLHTASLCCKLPIMNTLLYRPCTFSPTKYTTSCIRVVFNSRLSL